MDFQVSHRDGLTRDEARSIFLEAAVQTPAFMPVGTYGTVKGMLPRDITAIGAEIILGNTFHLWLRPGTDVIRAHGDLHDFHGVAGPILTDSGGFQVFSLDELRKVTEEGVAFKSPVNGDKVFLDPETSMRIQRDLGSDIVMIFDECTPIRPPRRRRSAPCSYRSDGLSAAGALMATIRPHCLALFRAVCTQSCESVL